MNCSAAKQLPQGLRSASVGAKRVPLAHSIYKHSKSADLLRKSHFLRSASVDTKRTSTGCSAPHVWRVPSSKALPCKNERLFDLLTLSSSYHNNNGKSRENKKKTVQSVNGRNKIFLRKEKYFTLFQKIFLFSVNLPNVTIETVQ